MEKNWQANIGMQLQALKVMTIKSGRSYLYRTERLLTIKYFAKP